MSHDHETFLIIIKIENRCDASFQYVDYFYLFISLLIDMITLLVYWNNSDSILILHDPQPPLNPFCRFHKFPQQSLQKTCKFQMGLVSMQSDPFPQPFCSNRILHRKTGALNHGNPSKLQAIDLCRNVLFNDEIARTEGCIEGNQRVSYQRLPLP